MFFLFVIYIYQVDKGYALSASQEFIACACNDGLVKLYTIGSLEYAGSLHYSEDKESKKTTVTFPDAIACEFSTSEKLGKYCELICLYDSLFAQV